MPPAPDLLNDPLLRTAPVIEGFKVLPPVVLYSKLGQGGMGAVYRGHHVKLDLAVAVKCLKPELTSDDGEYVKRFQREKVKITKGYWLGETEVTQGQWKAVMGTEPWKGQPGTQEGADVAASYASWTDAMDFCRKLTERERAAGRLPEGYRYILPTEAEWELACRAGSTTAYCFGDDASELAKYAVYSVARTGEYAHVVKQQRKANRWGFFDMHGNVWEWCLDECDYQSGVVTSTYEDGVVDPYNRGGPQRVYRGGGWSLSAQILRSADRNGRGPGGVSSDLGFRPALAARSDVK